MQALLVRVGIDATAGGWNGPVDPGTMRFAYVPIPEYSPKVQPRLRRFYEEIMPFLPASCSLPPQLHGKAMHLDPDFSTLTYGDGGQRAIQIQRLTRGDLLVFYAGLKPQDASFDGLVYGLVGLYVIDEIVPAKDVSPSRWGENAHTRRIVNPEDGDIVVRALKGSSGRLESCIPIGEYRDRAYRVRKDILADWNGLGVRDGYIQRSARLPRLLDAERFYSWFQKKKIPLIHKNN